MSQSGRALNLHRAVAAVVVVSFGLIASIPSTVRADQPLDPYAGATTSAPLDPYGTNPTPPPTPAPVLLVAPPAAPTAPPAPAQNPYPNNPYAPGAGTCPVGCAQSQAPLATYTPTPPQVERRPRYGLMAAGISIFAISWLSTAASGYYSGRSELAIPLAGPIVTAVDINRNSDGGRSYDMGTQLATGALVFDALVQTAGLAMIIAGAASKQTVLRRSSYTSPTVYPYGSGVRGTF